MRLSAYQYTMLKQMPDEFNIELARRYKQTTFGSLGRRKFVRRHGSKFYKTHHAYAAMLNFTHAEIWRKLSTNRLAAHFREVLQMRKAS